VALVETLLKPGDKQRHPVTGFAIELLGGPTLVWVRVDFRGGHSEKIVLRRGGSVEFRKQFEALELELPAAHTSAGSIYTERIVLRVSGIAARPGRDIRNQYPRNYFTHGANAIAIASKNQVVALTNVRQADSTPEVVLEVSWARGQQDSLYASPIGLLYGPLVGLATVAAGFANIIGGYTNQSHDWYSTDRKKQAVGRMNTWSHTNFLNFQAVNTYLAFGIGSVEARFDPPFELAPGNYMAILTLGKQINLGGSFQWSEHTPEWDLQI